MTKDEKEQFARLEALTKQLIESNKNYQQALDVKVENLSKIYRPASLENDILSTVQVSIGNAISTSLAAYDSPLMKLTKSVIESHSSEIRNIIDDSFTQVIRADDFKKSIVEAFSHKVARTIISNQTGLFDKVSNELKQDPIFKAKMVTAVSNIVNECLMEKKMC